MLAHLLDMSGRELQNSLLTVADIARPIRKYATSIRSHLNESRQTCRHGDRLLSSAVLRCGAKPDSQIPPGRRRTNQSNSHLIGHNRNDIWPFERIEAKQRLVETNETESRARATPRRLSDSGTCVGRGFCFHPVESKHIQEIVGFGFRRQYRHTMVRLAVSVLFHTERKPLRLAARCECRGTHGW